jgi:hypothetical protein
MIGQVLEIRIIPGRVCIAINSRGIALAVPAHAESVAVGRLDVLPRMPALIDQRMIGVG